MKITQLTVLIALALVLLLVIVTVWMAADKLIPDTPNQGSQWNQGQNGVWLQHGWLGADVWFEKYNKGELKTKLRNPASIRELADKLRAARIKYLFPHLAPTTRQGFLPETNTAQTLRFLTATQDMKVVPWIGGVMGKHKPKVENLENGLAGVQAGLKKLDSISENYHGISVYSEWEMDESEWQILWDYGSSHRHRK